MAPTKRVILFSLLLNKMSCVYHVFREAKDEQGENTLWAHNLFIYHQLNYRANKPLKKI